MGLGGGEWKARLGGGGRGARWRGGFRGASLVGGGANSSLPWGSTLLEARYPVFLCSFLAAGWEVSRD